MNPTLRSIMARRSIRRFTAEPVADELVHDLLEAAMAAPSAVACDPWHFVTVRDGGTREQIATVLPNGKLLATAPLGIVVCGDLDTAHGSELSYLLQDCSAAIENLLLAASMLALGACWLGIHPRQERIDHIRPLLGLPDHVLPVSAVALGHPAEDKHARTRFRPERVHAERW